MCVCACIFLIAQYIYFAAEEKEPYEAKARVDKQRYKDEISGYKNQQPTIIDSGNESDSS